ncbi:MAG: SigB/SigF/SigG family RNA polymerase sigma factor [Firmicutes bacterium]|nr:SigB/SigF/SigG family RNA polymerase sigma factor [Bacillota bacterium]
MEWSLSHIELPPYKPLSDCETKELLHRAQSGDAQAKQELVEANLRLVMSVVQRFAGRGEPEDLFQIGCIGLTRAVERFDLDYDVRFSTYAVPMIIGEIRRHLREDQTIRVSRSLKELAHRAAQVSATLEQALERTPTLRELAEALEVSPEDLVASLEAHQELASLQAVIYEDEGQPVLLQDQIGVPANTDAAIENMALRQVFESLSAQEQSFIKLRFFEEKTQSEIASLLGVSQAHVSRMEKNILLTLRSRLD